MDWTPLVRCGLLLGLLAGCRTSSSAPVDAAPDQLSTPTDRSWADGAAADGPARDRAREGAQPCGKPPCAVRPILFVHGFCGSNDDFFWLLDHLKTDPRYDSYQLAGREDHQAWPAGSVARRGWLFAFDYYVKLETPRFKSTEKLVIQK